jgi:alkanesulfonate monooxygenase SsuD/methylene tetrahydromethanopterin reductase-like flavin-dependent oxidoreductase (luciferase family)
VAGPLNMPRCPQGRPVLVQAGSSDTGRRFAARHAEAVFTAHMEKATAQAFYADLKALVAAEGRAPEQVLILPGLSPMIASTEAEAQRIAREVNDLSDPEVGRKRLSGRFGGHDFSHLPLDRPLTPDDFPPPSSVEAARSRTEVILGVVRREKPTLRQLLASLAGARGHFTVAGTPEQIADLIEDWFSDGVADGFNIMPPVLPAMLDVFSAEVIPLLQQRGLFRRSYEGTMLREPRDLDVVADAYVLQEGKVGVAVGGVDRNPLLARLRRALHVARPERQSLSARAGEHDRALAEARHRDARDRPGVGP